jgi:hypothetical protein
VKLDMPAPRRPRSARAAARRVVLATKRFTIGAAGRRTVTLRLRRKDLRTLVRRKRLAVRALVTTTTATGARRSASRPLRLLAPPGR